MTTRRTATGASVYETRPDCPARFHDSYSATRRAGCVCPAAKEARRLYIKRQQFARLDAAYVDPTGTRRRLRALGAIGYPLRSLGVEIGWTSNLGRLIWGNQRVHRSTAQLVKDAYERLSGTPGPSQRARKAAKRAGYAPPLAWDDDTIDDPDATPNFGAEHDDIVDEVAVRQAVEGVLPFGALTKPEKLALFKDQRHQRADRDLARQLGVSGETARRWRMAAEDAA
jgi:hypothetical protein